MCSRTACSPDTTLCVCLCVCVCVCVCLCVRGGGGSLVAAVVRMLEPFIASNLNMWALWESNVLVNIAVPLARVRGAP